MPSARGRAVSRQDRNVDADPMETNEEALRLECRQLRDEISRLHRILRQHGIYPSPPQRETPVRAQAVNPIKLGTAEKIVLFRALFRGREDVFPVRWESPDGRHGYSPKSERDWKAYNAARAEDRKRVDKETRKHIPLTDVAIHDHLVGKHTIGV